jgi:hypothetical protein
MLSRLERIESILAGPATSNTGLYMDDRDRAWMLSGSVPTVCAPETLTPRQFIVYRFGLFVQDLLVKRRGHPRVAVVIASSLPVHTPYTGNAFCHSIYHDAASATLFVRQERLDSVGEYVVVLAHALAHVRAGSMVSDNDAVFLQEFHRCLHVLCDDVFALRIPAAAEALPRTLATITSAAERDAAVLAASRLALD